jgi:uncharacterized protein YutE (UPF0331/DUF86 family)
LNRDLLYERELSRHMDKMSRILDEYRESPEPWSEKDLLGMERALQVLIEALIGLSRYVAEQRFGVKVLRTREALDELYARQALTPDEHGQAMKMVGFRNVLVHDYLSVEEEIVRALVRGRMYSLIGRLRNKLMGLLEESGPKST